MHVAPDRRVGLEIPYSNSQYWVVKNPLYRPPHQELASLIGAVRASFYLGIKILTGHRQEAIFELLTCGEQ